MNALPLPHRKTVLLSAGPQAGKTALLQRWTSECPSPAVLLRLTPEDANPAFLRLRCQTLWPEAWACWRDLETQSLGPSWGAMLGLALGLISPDPCLLIDDFHRLEQTAAFPELLALIRHYPAAGTLVIASRHRLPELDRAGAVHLDADDLGWHERPTSNDLQALPPELTVEVVALQLLGSGPPGPHTAELLRRRIVHQHDATGLVLRDGWGHAVRDALQDGLSRGGAENLEGPIWELARRHRRLHLKRSLYSILEDIPYQVRQRHAILLKLEGDHLLATRDLDLARGCYLSALRHGTANRQLQNELSLDLLAVATAAQERAAVEEQLHQLAALRESLPSFQQARLLNLEGKALWCDERADEAAARWQEVLKIPASGERSLHVEHFQALMHLHTHELNCGNYNQARHHAEKMTVLATRHRFQQDLLSAHAALLDCLIGDPTSLPPIQTMLGVPNEDFILHPLACFEYVFAFAKRYYELSQFEIAMRYFKFLELLCLSQRLTSCLPSALVGLLNCCWKQKLPEEAHRYYEQLASLPSFGGLRLFVKRSWAKFLAETHRVDEALALLAAEEARAEQGPQLIQLRFTQLWIRHQAGETDALPLLRQLLDDPKSHFLWNAESHLIAELGIRPRSARFSIKAFGPVTFACNGEIATSWPRKKALSLLAHLSLRPAGLPSEELANLLFHGHGTSEALHAIAYKLRQSLKPVGGEDLVESTRGHYRLRWEHIAFCDLHDFEALYRKAESLSADGNLPAAGLCYQLALLLTEDPVLEDVSEEFSTERERLEGKIRLAKDFLAAHRKHLLAALPPARQRSRMAHAATKRMRPS